MITTGAFWSLTKVKMLKLTQITRLKVPKVRALIEYFNFLVLFILYILAIEGLEESRLNWREGIFIVYALCGFLVRDDPQSGLPHRSILPR